MKEYRENAIKLSTHHGFGWQVGLELSPDDAAVAVRASDLAPSARVVGPVLLHLGFVDVGEPLAAVPRHVLLRVHALDLKQRRVLVLVRFRPNHTHKKMHQKIIKKIN